MLPPLSERLRPSSFTEIVGQPHLLGPDGFITRTIKQGKPLSIILWGPAGTGKTSIARLYAQAFNIPFQSLSAIFSGVADLKKVVKEAEERPLFKGTLLFVDEIHRFNKAQQDAFLPFLEKGSIVLIGATVENPSFYLNDALLSRTRVLKLNPLDDIALEQLLQRYETRVKKLNLDDQARRYLIQLSQGDGRYLYNLLENIENVESIEPIDVQRLQTILQARSPVYDRASDQHYNLISALHKAIRGSDPDAALYWFARMLNGGEDPLYLARRLIRVASEDVGQADPQALPLTIAARDAYQMLGSPEGELALAQIVIYLALAPKSNATYMAFKQAKQIAQQTSHLNPPATILNAPTRVMKELGYSQGYMYDHDTPHGFSGQNYFPEEMERQSFYEPVERGFEREMKKRLDYFGNLRNKLSS
ncbi:replication-associated recombination protein A [Parachlamydia acanthamoebae UV-7]|uniref:Replication-associated recombination protein A n=2 Tax=Parachlamydia acanthamoebae TaxID=83552 RepID=F8KYS4_PARAV|nr:replication-associated recombination protein A [Parachlamydia acanthamoebae]KIA78248.1 Replication-associated recombination protein A [Parachlamydia acanthamoebae]CCB86029.1 replication-associated recombination protein A [Parachlamydia acanthamoebae UV-7]